VPQKGIQAGAALVTGLSVVGGEMFLRGEKVPTIPPRLALEQFLHFLGACGTDVLLAAHNGDRFDKCLLAIQIATAALLAATRELPRR